VKNTPKTPEEWQFAVDAADALLHLDAARQYGLVTGGPKINVDRCEIILRGGRRRDIRPQEGNVERLIEELTRITPC
jgi:hypothetical protein